MSHTVCLLLELGWCSTQSTSPANCRGWALVAAADNV